METPLKILILDDERSGVQHLRDALDDFHKLTWTHTIDAALAELRSDKQDFDVIVCGTHLLAESMFDFLKQVKLEAQSKRIPFMCFRAATTDFAEKSDCSIRQTSKMLGANAYISVPVVSTPGELRASIELAVKKLMARASG